MSHFAKIENGIVTTVIVAEQDVIDSLEGTWVQTSYNTGAGVHRDPATNETSANKALRANFAGIGMVYDYNLDAFYAPQPYPSWSLNETSFIWESPVAHPDDGESYAWDEDAYQEDNTTGWTQILG